MTSTLPRPGAPSGVSHDDLHEHLPHRWPMLLIDRIQSMEPGVRGTAVKNVSGAELWFQGHFPGQAVLPGVLVLEAMAQLAGAVATSSGNHDVSYLASVRSVRFRQPVVPGDQLVLDASRVAGGRGFDEFAVTARVDGQLVAEGNLCLADPDSRKV